MLYHVVYMNLQKLTTYIEYKLLLLYNLYNLFNQTPAKGIYDILLTFKNRQIVMFCCSWRFIFCTFKEHVALEKYREMVKNSP